MRWIVNHGSAYRIEFNVALAAEQISVGLDERGLVTAVPELTGVAVGPIDVLHIASPEGDDDPGDGCCMFGSSQQVALVGHEGAGVKRSF